MHVTVIPIEAGALGSIHKRLEKELEDLEIAGRIETIKTTALLTWVKILRKVLGTRGNSLTIRLQ